MKSNVRSVVQITHAAPVDYLHDFVALPKEYGTPAYEQREDIRAIQAAVRENLEQLDARIHFTERLRDQKVILKPNLVTVFHRLGMKDANYPETTDPRVIDAVVAFLQPHTRRIVIAESSGRGMPTQASFVISGLDRLARVRGVELAALEEQPVDRYLLPKAKVMHEVVIPRLFSEIVRGEAFYISIPKLKTNLYTGVTLGFKNAMGVLSYNLRQRNHNHAIDQKLVDLLHLFRPDLVIIDGIVGGEGNCPAPVEPVPSRLIISGNHPVETDRVATGWMGFDPAAIPLIRIADENGFNDPGVEILGEPTGGAFRPADPSLLGEWMQRNFPRVKVLVGALKNAPAQSEPPEMTPERLNALERACRGGCLATTRYAFDMLYFEQQKRDFALTVILGAGLMVAGRPMFYDASGKAYGLEEIRALPGKKLAVGSCSRDLRGMVDRYIDGCMPMPNSPHMLVHQLSGTSCAVMSPKNRFLLTGLWATLRACERRKAILRSGQRIDIAAPDEDRHYHPRELSDAEKQMDYLFEPFEPLDAEEIRRLCAVENRSILATFFP